MLTLLHLGLAFKVPDLDAYVRIEILSAKDNTTLLACIETQLSNGVTIEVGAVSWVTAFLAGGALLWAMFVISGSNPTVHYYHLTTAKFATYSLAFFTFLQNQALIGMTSVPLPPIVSSWTQNLSWATGVIETAFLQNFFHWYVMATGGVRSALFNEIAVTSVLVQKRDLGFLQDGAEKVTGLARRAWGRESNALGLIANPFEKRSNTASTLSNLDSQSSEEVVDPSSYKHITVKGIERVAFKANIEQTNLFLTAYSSYIIFALLVIVLFLAFTAIVKFMAKKRIATMEHRLPIFRKYWKGTLQKLAICIIILGYPSIIALSLWEFTMKDSPALVVLAVVIFLTMVGSMGLTIFRLYTVLRRTGVMPFSYSGPLARFATKGIEREKPAFTSWRDSDPNLSESKATASRDLKQFSILTVPYRRAGVYWVLPLYIFIFTKSALVGLSQQHLYNAPNDSSDNVGTVKGIAQAIGFLVIDLLWLIGVAWVKPWMDRPTNVLGITGAVIGLINAVCLLIFTEAISSQAVSGIFHHWAIDFPS